MLQVATVQILVHHIADDRTPINAGTFLSPESTSSAEDAVSVPTYYLENGIEMDQTEGG